MKTIKSQMLTLGYILYNVDDDGMVFVNIGFYCECYFKNGLYVRSQFEGLNGEVTQNIENNYKKSCTSLFVIDEDDDYFEIFETKDGKTYISISYAPVDIIGVHYHMFPNIVRLAKSGMRMLKIILKK